MSMDSPSRAPGTTAPGVLVADAPAPATTPARPERRIERRELVRIFLVLLALTFVLRFPPQEAWPWTGSLPPRAMFLRGPQVLQFSGSPP